MIEGIISGAGELFTWEILIATNIGILLGIIFGSVPGLTVDIAIALFTPITFALDPTMAILTLLGIYCGGTYGGSITAITIKTPGTPAAAATLLDGHPLAERGQARKALDMAIIGSVIGGVISALALLTFAPQISKLTLNFGPAEFFTLAIFGLSVIAGVSGKNIIKGLIGACIGYYIAMIGMDSESAVARFTFDDFRLLEGIPLLVGLVGLFIISELLIKSNNRTNDVNNKTKPITLNNDGIKWKEVKGNSKTLFRSSIIGTIVGAIPGTGGGVAAFLSYDQAKKRSKNRDKFGTGELEGIGAAETANSATTGSTLIPLLTLGIPGDGVTAILLGSLMLHGLTPGPTLFEDHTNVIYAIMLGLLLINILMLLQGRYLVKWFSKISVVPYSLLIPLIAVFSATGSYAVNYSSFHVILIMIIGILGYVLFKLGFSTIPVLLGFILGPIAEENYRNAMVISDGSFLIFLTRPFSLIFVILTLMTIITFFINNIRKKENGDSSQKLSQR
ncbi:tripartite tricarboxylate transporter permease [Alteribacillus sp. YIM 98480]|uniref:tripartite tricarboxylate transporter permease n=1 Tax=Alteribacillus sp. YIM 98480 TaxID=2606599 RepID=UPI00131EAB23|nr:tripartite tricarboxylate transporter permease [Alteribacillus sp. YIM 98480]